MRQFDLYDLYDFYDQMDPLPVDRCYAITAVGINRDLFDKIARELTGENVRWFDKTPGYNKK